MDTPALNIIPTAIDTGRIPLVEDVVDAIWADHGDVEITIETLYQRASDELSEPPSTFLQAVLRAGCLSLAASAQRRLAGKKRGASSKQRQLSCVDDWSAAIVETILETFEVRPGLKLGDAKGHELHTAAQAYDLKATDAKVKARWLRLIAEKVDWNGVVRETLTAETVEALRIAARETPS